MNATRSRERLAVIMLSRIGLQLVGAALVLGAAISRHGPNTLRSMAIGEVLSVVAVTWWFIDERDRFWALMAPFLAVTYSLSLADQAGKGHSTGTKAIVAAIVVVLFVAPMPLLGVLYRRRQDEMQRSVATTAGAIALACLVVASFGYYLLELIIDLPQVSLGIVAATGAGLFLVVWGLLRISVSR